MTQDPGAVGTARRYFREVDPFTSPGVVEHDFDTSPTLRVPGDWNSQRPELLLYEGTVWYERAFTYHPSWTAPLFRALSFVIRVMCVDTEEELHEAAAQLRRHPQASRAQASFDDMSLVSYAVVKNEIAPELGSQDPLREVALQNRLVTALKAQYERVSELSQSEQ